MPAGGPMTEAMYYILLVLTVPSHGYQIMASVPRASQGRVRMGPGTLYGVLTRMEAERYIEIVDDDGRRKTYAITETGRAALRAETERLRAMLEDQTRWREDTKCLTE
ncbi:PadR family transcriptional regulator [Oscillibacter sp.]|uniref:PadR family transcriptional regulator n=1 Tax=Oscillibacter sp. TaxID=1945593 RepID=UPI0028A02556|nr:PadR family transcriptional regulator [Oscillibacter sp.]